MKNLSLSSHRKAPSARIPSTRFVCRACHDCPVSRYYLREGCSDQNDGHALVLRAFDSSVIIIVKSGVNFGHIVTFVTIYEGDVRVSFSALRSINKVSHYRRTDSRSRQCIFSAPTIPSAMTRINFRLFGSSVIVKESRAVRRLLTIRNRQWPNMLNKRGGNQRAHSLKETEERQW